MEYFLVMPFHSSLRLFHVVKVEKSDDWTIRDLFFLLSRPQSIDLSFMCPYTISSFTPAACQLGSATIQQENGKNTRYRALSRIVHVESDTF